MTKDYDLVVIGGGIFGACVAKEACSRGWRVALLEKNEIGGGTSDNSLRILHGGFRYLKRLKLFSARRYILEQREWLRRAPHLTRPLRCRALIKPSLLHHPIVLRVAIALYNTLCWDRHRGVQESHHLPPAFLEETESGVFINWYDAQMLEPKQIVKEMVQEAVSMGLEVYEDTEVETLVKSHQGIVRVDCRDKGTSFQTRATVTALGPFTNSLLRKSELPQVDVHWLEGWNALLDLDLAEHAEVVESTLGNRMFLLTPLGRQTLVGTGQYALTLGPEDWQPEAKRQHQFLGELSSLHPALKDCRERVVRSFSGLIPTDKPGSDVPSQKDRVVDYTQHNVGGLVAVVGAKYTSARWAAERAVDLIAKQLV